MRRCWVLVVVLLSVLAVPASADAARPLRIGFFDGLFATADGAPWLDRAKTLGAEVVRIPTGWGQIAPTKPSSPTDPADPAYRWTALDGAVAAATARGLEPIVSLTGAPAWAEGSGRPKNATPGTWKPNGSAYESFARALARRYSGSFAAGGVTLPRVKDFQAWNEPNLSVYLAPQWTKKGKTFTATGPKLYRAIQNAFTSGVRAVQRDAVLVTAGTAPFGDPQAGGSRIMPARFWRSALCLTAKLKRVRSCGVMRFDVLAHHPYSVFGPLRKSLNGDDVSLPDMGKLTKIIRAAEGLGTAPGGKHRLWVTEVSWDSGPDDPDGVTASTQATWLSQSLMVLWRQGVDTITWNQLRDQAGPDYAATVQSGVYRFNEKAKPSARAFAFPLAVERATKRRSARVWLRAPAPGSIALQVRKRGTWTTVKTVTAAAGSVREVTVKLRGGDAVRAVQGLVTTLPAAT